MQNTQSIETLGIREYFEHNVRSQKTPNTKMLAITSDPSDLTLY